MLALNRAFSAYYAQHRYRSPTIFDIYDHPNIAQINLQVKKVCQNQFVVGLNDHVPLSAVLN